MNSRAPMTSSEVARNRSWERWKDQLQRNENDEPVCDQCGTVIPPDARRCNACYERRRANEQRAARIQDAKRTFEQSAKGIDDGQRMWGALPTLDWARFDNVCFRGEISARLLSVEGWSPRQHGSLMLLGPTGRGKTAVLVAWLHALHEDTVAAFEAGRQASRLRRFLFVTAYELVRAQREHPLGQGEPELVRAAREAPLLLLDEVGPERGGESLLFELSDHRYQHQMVTAVTTGLTQGEFISRYGPACWRRFTEHGQVVDLHEGGA